MMDRSLSLPIYHALNADFPSSHFDRGMWDQVLGNYAETEARWRKSLELDPDFLPAPTSGGFSMKDSE